MKILEMNKRFLTFQNKEWLPITQNLTSLDLPKNIDDFSTAYRLKITLIIELDNNSIVDANCLIKTNRKACMAFEKPSTQEEYNNFLKILEIFEKNT